MDNKNWIITYDIHDEIKNIYDEYDYKKYYLNYSITNPSKGQEYMFFSKNIDKGDIVEFLELALK